MNRLSTLALLSLLTACGSAKKCLDSCGSLKRTAAPRVFETELRFESRTLKRSIPRLRAQMENRASASAQFPPAGLEALREQTSAELFIVDLRSESHAFVNGYPVSWTAFRNLSNAGLSWAQIQEDETLRIEALRKQKSLPVVFSETSEIDWLEPKKDKTRLKPGQKLKVKRVQNERAIVESAHAHYVRIPVEENLRPSDDELDRWITAMRLMPKDAWVHFHCSDGGHRSSLFLILYDILKNARFHSLDELIQRGLRLPDDDDTLRIPVETDWRYPYRRDQAYFLEAFYAYAKANPGTDSPLWGDWVRQK